MVTYDMARAFLSGRMRPPYREGEQRLIRWTYKEERITILKWEVWRVEGGSNRHPSCQKESHSHSPLHLVPTLPPLPPGAGSTDDMLSLPPPLLIRRYR